MCAVCSVYSLRVCVSQIVFCHHPLRVLPIVRFPSSLRLHVNVQSRVRRNIPRRIFVRKIPR